MRRWRLLAMFLALSACSTPPQVAPPPMPVVEAPPQPPEPKVAQDLCGVAEHQHLIGRSRLESPVPIRPERQRVTCTTCPAAQDEDPSRLTILFDSASGRITEIRCG